MSSRPITQTAVTAAKAALRKAVKAYRAEHEGWARAGRKGMERWALDLLDRLANSNEAPKAFERLKLKDGRERDLSCCAFLPQNSPARFRSAFLLNKKCQRGWSGTTKQSATYANLLTAK